ncbi:MAG: ROK family protein [Lachnospiraceae bacterium]|nr:ROK family protein [Lachnospiraceae bacterium]
MGYIGIDIGGTQVKFGLVSQDGCVSETIAFDVAFDGYETPIMDTVMEKLVWYMKEHHLTEQNIQGIGVSATGQIDVVNGVVIGTAGHIKNWDGCRIKDRIKSVYSGPVSVMNDANCAALAEQWLGGAKGATDAVVVTIGTGIGGGIIVDSKILCGFRGVGGEIGHFTIRNNGIKCTCGNRGCYERYGSTTALVKAVKQAVKKGVIPEALFEGKAINGRTIFDRISRNQELAKIVDKWIGHIADGIIGLVHIFNPQVVLLSGGVSAQKELFIDPLREKILSIVMPQSAINLRIDAAKMGNDAGLVGAVYYCITHGN